MKFRDTFPRALMSLLERTVITLLMRKKFFKFLNTDKRHRLLVIVI